MRRGKIAQWSGLYDRMHTHEPEETERRLELAAEFGESLDTRRLHPGQVQ